MALNWKKSPSYTLWEKIKNHDKTKQMKSNNLAKINDILSPEDPRNFNDLMDLIAKEHYKNKKSYPIFIKNIICQFIKEKSGKYTRFKSAISDIIRNNEELKNAFINELKLRHNNPHYTFNVNKNNLKQKPLIMIKGKDNQYNENFDPKILTAGFFKEMLPVKNPLQPNQDVENITNTFLNTNPTFQ